MKKHWIKKRSRISNINLVIIPALLIGMFTATFYMGMRYKVLTADNNYRQKALIDTAKQIENLKEKITELKYDNGILRFKTNVWRFKNPQRDYIIDTVYRKALEYDVDPLLIVAIIQKESNFKVKARSSVAVGLMQVNYEVWKDTFELSAEEELYEIERNIDIGIKIFKGYLTEAKGDIALALHLYNNGYKYNNREYAPDVINKFNRIVGE